MTTQARFTLNGLEDYLNALSKMELDFDQAVAEAVQAGADEVKIEMQALAPVYFGPDRPDVIPGNLANHIKIKGPSAEGAFIFVEVGVIHDKNFTDAATRRYGNVMEYGSSSVQARPFIRPGIERARKKWREAIKAKLKEKTGQDFG